MCALVLGKYENRYILICIFDINRRYASPNKLYEATKNRNKITPICRSTNAVVDQAFIRIH